MIRSLFCTIVLALLLSAQTVYSLGLESRHQSWNNLFGISFQSGPPPHRWGDSWLWIQSYRFGTGRLGATPRFAKQSFRTLNAFHLLQKRLGRWRVSVALPMQWAAGEGVTLLQSDSFSKSWILSLKKIEGKNAGENVGVDATGWQFSYGLFFPDRHRPFVVLPNVTAFFLSSSGERQAVIGFPITSYKHQISRDWSWAGIWRFQVDRILRPTDQSTEASDTNNSLNYNVRFFALKAQLQKKWGRRLFSTIQAGVSFAGEEQTLDRSWNLLSERKLEMGYQIGASIHYSFGGRPPRVQ